MEDYSCIYEAIGLDGTESNLLMENSHQGRTVARSPRRGRLSKALTPSECGMWMLWAQEANKPEHMIMGFVLFF